MLSVMKRAVEPDDDTGQPPRQQRLTEAAFVRIGITGKTDRGKPRPELTPRARCVLYREATADVRYLYSVHRTVR